MPLSEEQQNTLKTLQDLAQTLSQEPAKHVDRIRKADAIQLFDTRGQKPDLSLMSDQQLKDMFDYGRANPAINQTDPTGKLGIDRLMNITSDRGPGSKRANKATGAPEVIVPASREYLENAVGEWMKSINYAPDSSELLVAEMNIRDIPGKDLGPKVGLLRDNYEALQKAVQAESGEVLKDAGIEQTIDQLRQQVKAFEQQAFEFKVQRIQQVARVGAEFAAAQGFDANAVEEQLALLSGLDQEARMDLSGTNIRGLDLSKSDLSRVDIDAETLSQAKGLKTVKGVDPKILATARAVQELPLRLADLNQRLEKLENKSGVVANLRNIRHGGVEGERNHLLKEIEKANEALHQTRAQITSDKHAQMRANGPGNEFEPRTTYQLGEGVNRRQGEVKDPRMERTQASQTFKVDAQVALNEQGASLAFAKTQIGSKSARMKEDGANRNDVEFTQGLEGGSLDNVAALYGTTKAVDAAPTFRAKQAALGGEISSLLTRSVATSVVDEALGMNAMAKEKFGIDENGRNVGISVGVPGSSILVRGATAEDKESFLDINYENPTVQKGLYDLQAQDYITGQIDRHSGNIFVDPHTGQVSGIDNDMAFPTIDREQMVGSHGLNGKAVQGAPQFLHSDTADKIEALTPEALRTALQSIQPPNGVAPLEPEAIEGAVQRLQELQAEIKTMRKEGRVVEEFSKDTFNQAMARQQEKGMDHTKPRTSYLATAVLEQKKSIALGDTRIAIKKDDVPMQRPPDARLAAYQAMVGDARKDFAANPNQIQDKDLVAMIFDSQDRLLNLENQLEGLNAEMTAAARQLNEARTTGQAAPVEKAFDKIQQARQETLQKIKTEQQNLSKALDVAAAPLKPALAEQARLAVPRVQVPVQAAQPQNQAGIQAAEGFKAKAPKAKIEKKEAEVLEINEPQAEIQLDDNLNEQPEVEVAGIAPEQNPPGPEVAAQGPGVDGANARGRDVKKSTFASVRDALKGAATTAKNSVADRLERKGGEQKLSEVDNATQAQYKAFQQDLGNPDKKAAALEGMDALKKEFPGLKQMDRSKVGQVVNSGLRDAAKSVGSKLKT
ncbi:hypothetical protein [Prosthecobacter sp.]|uniref:hypothetical protein n=1 Tax=Prosthecobacter sp. TaxID=1965333 RepID=UPI003784CBC0